MTDAPFRPYPLRIARRIPDGLPFTLRSRRRPAVWLAVAIVVAVVFVLVTDILRIPTFSRRTGLSDHYRLDLQSDPIEFYLAIAIMGVLTVVAVALILAIAFGGPLLGCDGEGLWVRTRRLPSRAVFLRWEEIRLLYPLPHWKMVGVATMDPGFDCGSGGSAAVERFGRSLLGLPRLGTSTMFTAHDETEVLTELARYARGRCEVRRSLGIQDGALVVGPAGGLVLRVEMPIPVQVAVPGAGVDDTVECGHE